VGLAQARPNECMTLWGEPEWVYVQNVEQLHVSSECNWHSGHRISQQYTSWGRSSYKHAAYRLVQCTPQGGRWKHSSRVIQCRALAPIAVARSDRLGDFNTGNASRACGYPYRAIHPSVWLFFVCSLNTTRGSSRFRNNAWRKRNAQNKNRKWPMARRTTDIGWQTQNKSRKWLTARRTIDIYSRPPNRGHFGTAAFVLSSEVVLFSEVV